MAISLNYGFSLRVVAAVGVVTPSVEAQNGAPQALPPEQLRSQLASRQGASAFAQYYHPEVSASGGACAGDSPASQSSMKVPEGGFTGGVSPDPGQNVHQTNSGKIQADGTYAEDIQRSGVSGAQLKSIHSVYDPKTGVEESTNTTANGAIGHVRTTVQGNQTISEVSGDADVVQGVTKMVNTHNADGSMDIVYYKQDGTTTSYHNVSDTGKSYASPWKTVGADSTTTSSDVRYTQADGKTHFLNNPNSQDNSTSTLVG